VGKVFVVATPIGNLTDISHRALEVLRSVNLIAAEDTRRTLGMLNHFGITASVISNFKHNEQKRARQLLERVIKDGIDVAVVSDAGTPCISDPGGVLVRLARENGVEVFAVPGASGVTAALSVSGFAFTSFAFMGFVPRTNKGKTEFFDTFDNKYIDTFVFFESPNRIIPTLKTMMKRFPECCVCVINDITKFYEKTYWGGLPQVIESLESFANANFGEYTVVVNICKSDNDGGDADDGGISVEAMIVDKMVKNGLTLKEAVSAIADGGAVNRNDAYKASLNLKKIVIR
jgi:16S rRNA (cytidine1402-2'-O)-methyltransferase